MKPSHWGTILLTLLGLQFGLESLERIIQAIQMFLWLSQPNGNDDILASTMFTHFLGVAISAAFSWLLLTQSANISLKVFGNLDSVGPTPPQNNASPIAIEPCLYVGFLLIGVYFLLSGIRTFLLSVSGLWGGGQAWVGRGPSDEYAWGQLLVSALGLAPSFLLILNAKIWSAGLAAKLTPEPAEGE